MEVFVARQPIFTKNEEVYAYELLYRNNNTNVFNNMDGDHATADVIINSFLNIGLDQLSSGKPCFVNFTENLLKNRVPSYFPPRDIVVEILETVKPTDEVLEICKELKAQGYRIALDDFVFTEHSINAIKLLQYADIVKIDFLSTTPAKRRQIVSMLKGYDVQFLAEKIETREEFEGAVRDGYRYFQGFFFSKPVIITTHDIPSYMKAYFQIINDLSEPEPNIQKISEMIEQDLSLSYKLLKLINSPAFRPNFKINSIHQAIVLLGLIEIKKWIYVLLVRDSKTKNASIMEELIRLCMSRAKFAEQFAIQIGRGADASSYFLCGMFSVIDSIIQRPLEVILNELPLKDEVKAAIRGEMNEYREVIDIIKMVEQADWMSLSNRLEPYNVSESELSLVYKQALLWAEQLLVTQEELSV